MNKQQGSAGLLKSFICVAAGNFLYAITVTLFLLPSGLVTGGTTGLALTITHFFNIPISWIVFGFNMAMLVVGLITLGKKFAMTTLASSIIYPFALDVCGRIFDGLVLTDDMLICTIFTGLGIGISLGIVIRSGASTGGIDIPTLVLHKYFHIPVSVVLYAFDFCILLSQAIFRPIENVLYGIVLIMVYTIVLDKMLLVGTTRTEIKIISNKSEEILARILSDIDRGVTILSGEGGFSREKKQIVMTVVSNREVPKVEKLIHSIDPESFMVINRINEVNGRGFSMKKRYG